MLVTSLTRVAATILVHYDPLLAIRAADVSFMANKTVNLVSARFLPGKSLYWSATAKGPDVAQRIPTKPFAALRIYSRIGFGGLQSLRFVLFIVSTEKPPAHERYISISPHTDNNPSSRLPIRLLPHPPDAGGPLYVHTQSFVEEICRPEDASEMPANTTYSLHPSDKDRFIGYIREDVHENRHYGEVVKMRNARSGNGDLVQSGWDTWSGQSQTSNFARNVSRNIRASISDLTQIPKEKPTIHREIDTFVKIGRDYSWSGINSTFQWITSQQKNRVLPVLDHLPTRPMDPLKSVLNKPDALSLASLKIPFNGEKVQPPAESVWDDEEDWEPSLELAPKSSSAPPIQHVHTVVFDVFGCLVDRRSGLLQNLKAVAQRHPLYDTEELLQVYLECLAENSLKISDPSFSVLLRSSLIDCFARTGMDLNGLDIDKLLDTQTWPVWSDVTDAICAIRKSGVNIMIIPPGDDHTLANLYKTLGDNFSAYLGSYQHQSIQLPPGKCYQDARLAVLQQLPQSLNISPSQIVVVSEALYSLLEPAALAGMCTMWLRRSGDLEGSGALAAVNTVKPSGQATGLLEVAKILSKSLPP